MGAEVVRINQPEGKRIEFPVSKDIKLTKDGKIKKTINNTKENRDSVQPIKKEDIPKMVKYFKSKIDNAQRINHELSARRDLSMFIMGINIALRISDLITLKWNDIYNDDWTFRTGKVIKPKKTSSNNKHVLLKFNPDFKEAIELYRPYCGEIKDMNSYIFTGGDEGHISDATIERTLKIAAKEIDIKYNINTHSLRKTFCRLRYDDAEDKGDVLVKLMDLLGHSSVKITKRYICISEEEIEDLFNSVSIGCQYIYEDVLEDDNNYESEIQINQVENKIISIDQNILRDIIKMVYQDGINNTNETDSNTHVEAIDAAMEIIMDSVIG